MAHYAVHAPFQASTNVFVPSYTDQQKEQAKALAAWISLGVYFVFGRRMCENLLGEERGMIFRAI